MISPIPSFIFKIAIEIDPMDEELPPYALDSIVKMGIQIDVEDKLLAPSHTKSVFMSGKLPIAWDEPSSLDKFSLPKGIV